MVFERVADVSPNDSIGARADKPATAVEVKISALIGVSIPVIVREGETTATVALTHLALDRSAPALPAVLTCEIERTGSRSVYGDFVVTFRGASGNEKTISRAQGVAVYTPNPMRRIKLDLQADAGAELRNGVITVVFRQRPEDGGGVLARGELIVP